MEPVTVSGPFDDMRSPHVRMLHEASRRGPVHVKLWSDAAVGKATGAPPKFPQAEREYLLSAVRYVAGVTVTDDAVEDSAGIADAALAGFPSTHTGMPGPSTGRKRVVVTGCYDWFHSGHVAFFEECAGLGDLVVVVGHDATITLLKGKGHPMFHQEERLYMVQAVRHVSHALVSSGMGWLDAAPEIEAFRPDIYAVNEDGDRPEKRGFCAARGIEYRVLKRVPHAGLPRRESTNLRGF